MVILQQLWKNKKNPSHPPPCCNPAAPRRSPLLPRLAVPLRLSPSAPAMVGLRAWRVLVPCSLGESRHVSRLKVAGRRVALPQPLTFLHSLSSLTLSLFTPFLFWFLPIHLSLVPPWLPTLCESFLRNIIVLSHSLSPPAAFTSEVWVYCCVSLLPASPHIPQIPTPPSTVSQSTGLNISRGDSSFLWILPVSLRAHVFFWRLFIYSFSYLLVCFEMNRFVLFIRRNRYHYNAAKLNTIFWRL